MICPYPTALPTELTRNLAWAALYSPSGGGCGGRALWNFDFSSTHFAPLGLLTMS